MRIFSCLLVFSTFLACSKKEELPSGFQGQGPTPLVSTITKPTQPQWKGIWYMEDSTTYFTNDFEGGRLNGAVADGGDHYTLLITAENEPINPSPWYAFKVWSRQPREITIQLTYQDSRSRYYPKTSKDGVNFLPLDSARYKEIGPGEGEFGISAAPESVEIRVEVGPEPLWITAQELWTSSAVFQWMNQLEEKAFVSQQDIGKSRQGRPIRMMTIGDNEASEAVLIISRQHPPEVTGFLAMKSFIETIAGESEQSAEFRDRYVTYVVPLMNPDGVDNGHWRHNVGGIDLNRDWEAFNQPETASVRDFLTTKKEEGIDFVFGVDFHSTWDDIYYPIDSTLTKESDWVVFEWINSISGRLPQKKTNIRPSKQIEPTMVSRNYFYQDHDMPAIVFELGDNTPRDFLQKKGEVSAEELMRILLRE